MVLSTAGSVVPTQVNAHQEMAAPTGYDLSHFSGQEDSRFPLFLSENGTSLDGVEFAPSRIVANPKYTEAATQSTKSPGTFLSTSAMYRKDGPRA